MGLHRSVGRCYAVRRPVLEARGQPRNPMERHLNPSDAGERECGASAPRKGTEDPRHFLIPGEHLPPGFAARLDDASFEPAATSPAATVVVARPGRKNMEVLLLRRPTRSGFAAGAWVFPGGRVDPSDSDPSIASGLAGLDPAEWADRLGLEHPAEALAFVVAALREAWEETGILIGHASGGSDLQQVRRALLSGELDMAEAVARTGIRFRVDDLIYIAHWITPEPEPRRYDTRFFLARVGLGTDCVLEGEELAEGRWMTPGQAMEQFREGAMMLLPPTADTLRRLGEFSDLDEAWSSLVDAPVPSILPRMRRDPAGVMIEF
ncbi:NUDIX domain-containing protein [soil metagenome]